MKQHPKCPRCGKSFRSQTHRTRCLGKPRKSRISSRAGKTDWGRVLGGRSGMAISADTATYDRIVANGDFFIREGGDG